MPAMHSGFCLDEIECQWHDLAERRLAHYQELWHSGRWAHYFKSREEFAMRMFDVIRVAKTFSKLAGRPYSLPKRPAPTASNSARDLCPAS